MKLKLFIDSDRVGAFAQLFNDGKTILFARSYRRGEFDLEIEIDLDEIDIKELHGNVQGNITFKKKV